MYVDNICYIFSIPCIILALPSFPLSILVVDQIHGHIIGCYYPCPLRFVPCIVYREITPALSFLVDSRQIPLTLATKAISAVRSFYFSKVKISPRWDSNLGTNATVVAFQANRRLATCRRWILLIDAEEMQWSFVYPCQTTSKLAVRGEFPCFRATGITTGIIDKIDICDGCTDQGMEPYLPRDWRNHDGSMQHQIESSRKSQQSVARIYDSNL